ncbi:molybdopterin-binding protein [Sphingomonas sp.]|uniref:molybdopterin-binding protein n=1 Tax=Sphingomonas sp. TaxID=28214 RepID=UPI002C3606EE|nr:molybdopterin-binding protein [Sphingomonas sp.]HTG37385.1 molybdopterin-binding protein [Sphingomonas sp.]
MMLPRRRFLSGVAAGAGGLVLAGCDRLTDSEAFRPVLLSGERLNYASQRLWLRDDTLAREYAPSEMSPVFRANGNTMPQGEDYARHLASRFADWRLVVDGMVARPLGVSLAQLHAMPAREQITRHDCVEGWSAIGKWTGPRVSALLAMAGILSDARYIVFHCADSFGANRYYESIDLRDAMHPQTILAHTMNDQPLPVAHGAPIRLRVERQLGYKQAKYVMRIEARNTLEGIGRGRGGYWEDHVLYDWYAGI